MSDGIRYAQGYAKYSVTTMSLRQTEGFPDEPNPEWPKKDLMASEKDITRIFEDLKDRILKSEQRVVIGPVGFSPEDFDVKVYFDPGNLKSLFIVAETEEAANRFAGNIRLGKEPYHISTYRRSWLD